MIEDHKPGVNAVWGGEGVTLPFGDYQMLRSFARNPETRVSPLSWHARGLQPWGNAFDLHYWLVAGIVTSPDDFGMPARVRLTVKGECVMQDNAAIYERPANPSVKPV